jgi:hypothetical protein
MLLREAGITSVQAGVESLADGTLRLMRKGVSAAQNVALLRWCKEAGVLACWNVIYGFPHEDPGDYGRTLAIMEQITHLDPPSVCSPIRMDRYSPNYTRPAEHGFTLVAPMPAYAHAFPFPDEELRALAYYFRYEHPRYADVLERGYALSEFNSLWLSKQRCGEQGELAVRPHWLGGYVLVDSRFNVARPSFRLDAAELAVLLACDAPTTHDRALRKAISLAPGEGRAALERALARMIERRVIAEVGAHLVTLSLLPTDLGALRDRPAPGELVLHGERGTTHVE